MDDDRDPEGRPPDPLPKMFGENGEPAGGPARPHGWTLPSKEGLFHMLGVLLESERAETAAILIDLMYEDVMGRRGDPDERPY